MEQSEKPPNSGERCPRPTDINFWTPSNAAQEWKTLFAWYKMDPPKDVTWAKTGPIFPPQKAAATKGRGAPPEASERDIVVASDSDDNSDASTDGTQVWPHRVRCHRPPR
jgi:hypothetical protein